jgi:hypothetical protein
MAIPSDLFDFFFSFPVWILVFWLVSTDFLVVKSVTMSIFKTKFGHCYCAD